MLDIKLIREQKDLVKSALNKRGSNIDIDLIQKKDEEFRKINLDIENNNAEKNNLVKQISVLIREGKNSEAENTKNQVKKINDLLISLEEKSNLIKNELNALLLSIPNIPFDEVPLGKDENDNVEVRKFSEPTKFSFKPKSHWDLGEQNKLIDLQEATKITGSRFSIYKGKGALLMNALQQFTIEKHINSGYEYFIMPLIVNSDSLLGTGQLPKFEEDLFKLNFKNYYLSPTLEVQLTNYFSNKIFKKEDFPYLVTASSSNFRSEAGSTGRDVKGVIRQHQFLKTELVNICLPEQSVDAHEKMVKQAESILEDLKLPYRTIVLCTGDMGFSSKKTYDIEVWLPSYNSYKEISSCSNCGDFQARRSKIRYKDEDGTNKFVHTLNGSGVALDRLWAAVVENYQQEDGSIIIPDVLRKYIPYEKI